MIDYIFWGLIIFLLADIVFTAGMIVGLLWAMKPVKEFIKARRHGDE